LMLFAAVTVSFVGSPGFGLNFPLMSLFTIFVDHFVVPQLAS
jgi:hypothetical protein